MFIAKFYYNSIYTLKRIALRLKGAKVGKGVKLYGKIIVKYPNKLSIGDFSTINDGVLLNCKGGIIVGKYCRLSSNSQLHSTGLTIDEFPRVHKSKKIILEDNVWLGSSSVVTMGVVIGKNSTVGALSLVNKNIEALSFYGGIPAKKIKDIILKDNE